MTFNNNSWRYLPSSLIAPDSYTARSILQMLNTTWAGTGNLLHNIGPTPDGNAPPEAIEPLQTVGRWQETYSEADLYSRFDRRGLRCGDRSRKAGPPVQPVHWRR